MNLVLHLLTVILAGAGVTATTDAPLKKKYRSCGITFSGLASAVNSLKLPDTAGQNACP